MKRGEVWWVSFDPSLGGEICKTRPAVIVSNDASNRNPDRIQIIPLSSRIDKLYPCEAYVTLNAETSKAMADQTVVTHTWRNHHILSRPTTPQPL